MSRETRAAVLTRASDVRSTAPHVSLETLSQAIEEVLPPDWKILYDGSLTAKRILKRVAELHAEEGST